ncbi:methyltransferase domain-containing protein [Chlorobium phaeobacteroides]|uniref:Methyltransferase type 11 n=1 Tax=Chlorobium phaeobacteroides (strain DSM 266 / SMG 266 / 2430) TaxID=290317 RepID=A1BJ51_CHLPD|nr:methyltransferase domain-containing protein [Chlorobium phaeobacteroides]ABL66428.1 conserved hypothetical protein [Chlorobium phaeobacteroides DSM 266]
MNSVFRTRIDDAYCTDPANRLRWQKTLAFLQASPVALPKAVAGLDLGGRTPLTDVLEKFFDCPFHATAIDLDVEPLEGAYGVVTAFEVLEHLFNPLHALLQVRRVLAGQDARLFVSMPLAKPAMLASLDHFHEMSGDAALSLFTRAGFRVVRSDAFRIRKWPFYLTGLKPVLRAFYEKVVIYELEIC